MRGTGVREGQRGSERDRTGHDRTGFSLTEPRPAELQTNMTTLKMDLFMKMNKCRIAVISSNFNFIESYQELNLDIRSRLNYWDVLWSRTPESEVTTSSYNLMHVTKMTCAQHVSERHITKLLNKYKICIRNEIWQQFDHFQWIFKSTCNGIITATAAEKQWSNDNSWFTDWSSTNIF